MKHRWLLLAVPALVAGCALLRAVGEARAALDVVVTNAGDDEAAKCPHETECTLRKAIELVNADAGEGPYIIRFDPAVFPDDGDAPTIEIESGPLPAVAKADVTIDGTGAEVRVDGSALNEGGEDGLLLTGEGAVVRSLALRGFGGTCLSLSGAQSLADQVRVGGCGTGIAASGTETRLLGNIVGFGAGSNPATVATGILVAGSGIDVGDPGGGPSSANIVGNAQTAIQVGPGNGSAPTDVTIAGNVIGKAPSGAAGAPVGTGIRIEPAAGGARVTGNLITSVTGSGIVVGPDTEAGSSTGNRISGNRFETIGGMSIDLNGNGLLEPNDAGDDDTGPNMLLNHPVITRAVQSRIQGTACGGCTIEIYAAQHFPGGTEDFGTTPIPGGTLTAGPGGAFELDSPPVTPGQWITAIAIDDDGNTSEFAPSSRVGAGVAQCGDVPLRTGWNLVGFFGQASLPLGNIYPPDNGPTSKVSAIYRLIDGTLGYEAWFSNGGAGRTLNNLESGEAYWMHALQPASVNGGFSLTVPLPVALKAGWNEFVYIGAPADVRDALSSIAGKYTSVYRWLNDEVSGERWASHHAGLPPWTQGFSSLDTCAAYSIFMTEDATLTPLQP
ncbi:MAG: hypothetical protein WD557_07830 [Dehalococcoidia bacterium]